MSIKKYIANKDTTITDAYKPNIPVRGTYSNMGSSDSLEIFSLYGQFSNNSIEKSRILIDFPISKIKQDRQSSKIPAAGNVEFFLKLYNVRHPYSVPRDFSVLVEPISSSWEEGYGLDMENYSDLGYPTGSGANWIYSKSGSLWTDPGSDVLNQEKYTFSFINGTEDLNINITSLVEKWLEETINPYGIRISLSGSFEDGSKKTSFYTKKFSARSSEFFFNRPCIEAQWSPIVIDDRGKFFNSSSAFSPDDNKMNIYFYNKVNGSLKNIYNNILPGIKLYSDSKYTDEINTSFKNITNPSIGIYKAQISVNSTASIIYDKWYNTSSSDIYFKSSFEIMESENSDSLHEEDYILNIKNLKQEYSNDENIRFNIYSREKNWNPTVYSLTNTSIENKILTNLYYKIFRLNDNYVIIDYSTGSIQYSKTSYDKEGNYFSLDMSLLEKDYSYGIKFATYDGNSLKELTEIFKFRIK